MVIASPRVRPWLYFAAVVIVAGAAVMLYVRQLDKKANLEFDKLAAMKYEDALAEVRKNTKGASGTLNGRPITPYIDNLQPGKGIGFNPRFLNIGKSPAIIFYRKGDRRGDGDYYVLGKVLVREYVGRRWRDVTTAENEYLSYQTPVEE